MDKKFNWLIMAEFLSDLGTGISLITVPFSILKISNGKDIFSNTVLYTLIFVFLISFQVGKIIDRSNKKKYLYSVQFSCGFLIFISFLFLNLNLNYNIASFILPFVFVVGSIHYAIHFPARTAFLQTVVFPENYLKINSKLSIFSQLSTLIGALLVSSFLLNISLNFFLIFDFLTYMFSGLFYFFSNFPEVNVKIKKIEIIEVKSKNVLNYIWSMDQVFFYLFLGLLPSVGVLYSNYLSPVYISEILKENVGFRSLQVFLYCLGVIIISYFSDKIIKKENLRILILASSFAFGICYAFSYFNLGIFSFGFFVFFYGVFGGICGLSRSTLLMNSIENNYIGKVNSLFGTLSVFLRVFMVLFASKIIASMGILISLAPFLVLLFSFHLIYMIGWNKFNRRFL